MATRPWELMTSRRGGAHPQESEPAGASAARQSTTGGQQGTGRNRRAFAIRRQIATVGAWLQGSHCLHILRVWVLLRGGGRWHGGWVQASTLHPAPCHPATPHPAVGWGWGRAADAAAAKPVGRSLRVRFPLAASSEMDFDLPRTHTRTFRLQDTRNSGAWFRSTDLWVMSPTH